MRNLLIVAIFVMFFLGPYAQPRKNITNVKKVYVHGASENYSVLVEDQDTKEIRHIYLGNCTLKADAKDKVWVEYKDGKYTIHVKEDTNIQNGNEVQ